MTSTKTIDDIAQRIAVAIDTSRRAKPYDADANPVGAKTLDDITAGYGVDKFADLMPQRNKDGWLGEERLNQVVIDGLEQRKANGVRTRQIRSRARAERLAQINDTIERPGTPDAVRMTQAWAILRPLVPTISRIAKGKAAWARRYLGDVQDDVTQTAMTRFALMLAKSDHDLDTYERAAGQLVDEIARIPGDQTADKDASKQRKREAKARKSLMSLCNHMVMCSLVDLYREQNNLRWENLDIIETVMNSVNGKGTDPAFTNFTASKPPSFAGSRPQTPGAMHPDVLRVALSTVITERGLDRLCELLLANLNTDGAFAWTANAEHVFRSVRDGDAVWHAVMQATSHHADPAHSRAQAARLFVRKQFAFMPWFIAAVVDACTPQRIGYNANNYRAVVRAEFEVLGVAGLVPTVSFTSVRDASEILAAALACELVDA
jgi:hypothetical protein